MWRICNPLECPESVLFNAIGNLLMADSPGIHGLKATSLGRCSCEFETDGKSSWARQHSDGKYPSA